MTARPQLAVAGPGRRDARERRDALIRAAALCFAEKGYTVPLEEIADRAGVGRGTLYRNFRDRIDLALAVFERDIDQMEETLDLSRSIEELVAEIFRQGTRASALFTRLAIELPVDLEKFDGFHALGLRVEALLQPVADRAKAEGILREELNAKDLLLCMRMMSGLLIPQMTDEEVRTRTEMAMTLLMQGLAPPRP